jgi:hypothetical protein
MAEELKLSLEAFFSEQFARLIVIVKGDASPLAMAELLKFDAYLAALMREVCEILKYLIQCLGQTTTASWRDSWVVSASM